MVRFQENVLLAFIKEQITNNHVVMISIEQNDPPNGYYQVAGYGDILKQVRMYPEQISKEKIALTTYLTNMPKKKLFYIVTGTALPNGIKISDDLMFTQEEAERLIQIHSLRQGNMAEIDYTKFVTGKLIQNNSREIGKAQWTKIYNEDMLEPADNEYFKSTQDLEAMGIYLDPEIPSSSQPISVQDRGNQNQINFHSLQPVFKSFATEYDDKSKFLYLQSLSSGVIYARDVQSLNEYDAIITAIDTDGLCLHTPQTIAQICALIQGVVENGHLGGTLLELLKIAPGAGGNINELEKNIIKSIRGGNYGFIVVLKPSWDLPMLSLKGNDLRSYANSARTMIPQLLGSHKHQAELLYKSWLSMQIHTDIALKFSENQAGGSAHFNDIIHIKISGRDNTGDKSIDSYGLMVNSFKTGSNIAGLRTIRQLDNSKCIALGLTKYENTGPFLVKESEIESERINEIVFTYLKNIGNNKSIFGEKFKQLELQTKIKMPSIDLTSLEIYFESLGILVSVSLLRCDPDTTNRTSGSLNPIDSYFSAMPYYSYNYSVMPDYIHKVTAKSEKNMYNQVEKFLRLNSQLKKEKGKPGLHSIFTFHHTSDKGYELNPHGSGMYNLSKGGTITIKLKGVESVFEVFKRIPLIRKAVKEAMARIMRHGKFYEAGDSAFTKDSFDKMHEKMFNSPAYSLQRNEAFAIVAASLQGRKKTMEELWALFYTLGMTKSAAASSHGDNLELSLNTGAVLVDTLAKKALPGELHDTYENVKNSMTSYANVQSAGISALTQVINPGLELLDEEKRNKIESMLNADSYEMLHAKPQYNDQIGPHEEADDLNRSLAETNITIQINRAMCDMISSLTGADPIGTKSVADFVADAESKLNNSALPPGKKNAIRRIIDKFKTKAQPMDFSQMITGTVDASREWASTIKKLKDGKETRKLGKIEHVDY